MDRKSLPIRWAQLGLVAIPVLVLIVTLAYDTYGRYKDSIVEAYRVAGTIRSMSALQTEHFLADAKSILERLAQRPQIQALDATRCDSVLADLKQLQFAYANLLTLNANGDVVCSANDIPSGRPAGPDPKYYFSEVVRTGEFTVGKPAQGFITGRWVSTLAYPIKGKDGTFLGAVAIAIDLLNYRPIVPARDAPPGTVIGILNGEGTIIARSEDSNQRVGRHASEQNANSVLQQREGTMRARDYWGVDRFFSFTPVANSDWVLFVSLDYANVIAPVIHLAFVRLALVLVLLVAIASISFFLARRMAAPVEAISQTMTRVAAGALYERAPAEGPAELRQIAAGLNAMLDAQLKSNAALHQSEERFRFAFRTSPDLQVITNLESGRFLEINDGYTRLTGWTRDEVVGKTVSDINIWRHPEERLKLVQPLLQTGSCSNLEADFINKYGRVWAGLVSAHMMNLNGAPCILSIVRDISDRKAAEHQLHNLSFYDLLTRLPNRQLFMDRLEQGLIASFRNRRRAALLFIDLDDFKSINKIFDREQGDVILQDVAERLTDSVRMGDTVARYGGDKFVVLLEGLNSDSKEAVIEAEAVSGKILSALTKPRLVGKVAQQLSVNIGIALFGHESEDPVEPLKRAELAMYQAKAEGRNILRFFDPKMLASVDVRTALQEELREALDKGQFVLHYEAQVTNKGQITGAEALIRWSDPRRETISSAEFIPLAEESGLIEPLGQWVLETACAQLALWAARPHMEHLTISINVSTCQFDKDDFVQQVLSVLKRTGANPHRLKLELTENLLISNVDDLFSKMTALKSIGVGFLLDDFGTGYSSLSYLKRLPLEQVKINQGYVRDILTDPDDGAIAKMVIALASSMSLSVIAEGVESVAQRDALEAIGCHNYQGFLFSRPLPLVEFETLIEKYGSKLSIIEASKPDLPLQFSSTWI